MLQPLADNSDLILLRRPCARHSSGFHNDSAVPMTFVQLSGSKVQPLVECYQVQQRPHEIAQVSAGTITYINHHSMFDATNCNQYPHRYSVH